MFNVLRGASKAAGNPGRKLQNEAAHAIWYQSLRTFRANQRASICAPVGGRGFSPASGGMRWVRCPTANFSDEKSRKKMARIEEIPVPIG